MFANEACKGVQLLDLLEQRYDVVATNPPYMSNRNMGTNLSNGLKLFYKNNSDLYASFIARSMQLTNSKGFVSMICQQSFMFLSSFKDLRESILNSFKMRCVAHLGPHAFEDIIGEKVNTTMFSFSNGLNKEKNNKVVFHRLIDDEKKIEALKISIKENRNIFLIEQNTFKSIEGYPFVYWISKKIYSIFDVNKKIGDKFIIKSGMRIGNNDKYLRNYWEIFSDISKKNSIWQFYNKGGEFCKYYGPTEWLVDWRKQALNFYEINHSHRNKELYFKEGFTYSSISSKGFSCRYLKTGYVYDAAGPLLFDSNFLVLGYLNSKLFDYLLNLVNPTVNFQVDDLNRIPFHPPPPDTERRISSLVQQCVNIKKDALQFVINDREFKETAIQWGYNMFNEKGGGV